ncbi:hypothetical protein ACA910_005433 [Epithemia clementina (nom. ined.)]
MTTTTTTATTTTTSTARRIRTEEDDDWTKEQLMGQHVKEQSLLLGGASPNTNMQKNHKQKNKRNKGTTKKTTTTTSTSTLHCWGYPGHLTNDEAEAVLQLNQVVHERDLDGDTEFGDTILAFGPDEELVYALCRCLRHVKFNVADCIPVIQQGQALRHKAALHQFYPNPDEALQCPAALYFAQFPQLYTGTVDKTGTPIFISQPGQINVDAIELITTVDNIVKLHWNLMVHDLGSRLSQLQAQHPDDFKRFECFCVMDCAGLTSAQLNKKTLAIIKAQSAIDAVCFPETCSYMVVINAPLLFAASWRIIKGWLDPQSASKVEVISSKAASHARLLELVDAPQLPSDYGGTAPDTATLFLQQQQQQQAQQQQQSSNGGSSSSSSYAKLTSKVIYLRNKATETVTIPANMSLELSVYTRSTTGANFTLFQDDRVIGEPISVVHDVTDDDEGTTRPTRVVLNSTTRFLTGPSPVTVQMESKQPMRFATTSTHNFLLVFGFMDQQNKNKNNHNKNN